jgi:hypothetical protein
MKDLTSSVYNFEDLINGQYLYVDKTEYIWKLIRPYKGIYFMSRPRRFGKSLTVSTLKAIFQGKKDLFKGLAIHGKEYDWKEYPVIHLDMANCNAKNAVELEDFIFDMISGLADHFGVEIRGLSNATRFEFLIRDVVSAAGAPAVILLDEYDKPILNTLATPEVTACRDVLRGFYSPIKKCESLERFVFVTGVTKFSHVSLFSELNNLADITMYADYATMLGYTQQEFEDNFREEIDQTSARLKIPRGELLQKIKDWYDGYRFHAGAESVYNPVSLASFFLSGGEFNNYWFSTGTPSFLIELIRKQRFSFEEVLSKPVPGIAFSAFEVDRIDPLPLLLQTGYLTIRDAFEDFGMTFYNLAFPNFEVRSAFDTYLLNAYTGISKAALEGTSARLARNVRSGDVDSFMDDMRGFFASIPYDIQLPDEKYYQTVFFLLFLMLGVYIEAESRTGNGRIDAVAACGDWIYIFEFKLDRTADIALEQIKDKEYFLKYRHSGKRIILIGANFDADSRQISDWKIEEA